MKSRWLFNLFLLVLVCGLALVAWLEPGKAPPPEAARLTPLEPAAITRVRLERAEGKALGFERVEGGWWLTEPVRAPAAQYRVDQLLQLAQAPSLRQLPAGDPTPYGLERPRATVSFDDGPRIALGDSTPLEPRRYVAVDGAAHVVADTYRSLLEGRWSEFVSPRLLPPQAQPERFELPGTTLWQGDEGWHAEPAAERSADAYVAFADTWRHARALTVEPWPGGEEGGDTVRVHLRGTERPLNFRILARSPDLVLAREELGLLYRLPGERADELLALPAAQE